MNRIVFVSVLLLLVTSGSAQREDQVEGEQRDAGCGPGVYCGDSPDDDGDPCTAQPDDPRTSDYDESKDDISCPDYSLLMYRVPQGDGKLLVVSGPVDFTTNYTFEDWYK